MKFVHSLMNHVNHVLQRVRSFCKGFATYLAHRRGVQFNEQTYRAERLRGKTGLLSGLWLRWPKLHFLTRFADDSATQVEVLGQELRVLVEDSELGGRFDPRKPTVVIVTFDLTRTGAPKVALELLKNYASTHNTVFFSLVGGDRRREFAALADYCAFSLGIRGFPEQLQWQMNRICRFVRPELAIVNSIGSYEALAVFAKMGIPRIQLVHEIADIEGVLPFEAIARFADAIVFPADFVLSRALRWCPSLDAGKCAVVQQGVFEEADGPVGSTDGADSAGFLPESWGSDSFVVLACGLVDFRKGVDLFLASAALVQDRDPAGRVKFLWMGHGYNPASTGFSGYLRHQIETTGLGDRVHFGGVVRDLRPVYRCAGMLFLSSRFDPLPLVAQQAMGHGLPVLCFEGAGGIPGFLRADPVAAHGVVRYLDVAAAAERILAYANDEELRSRVGEAGKRVARKSFDTDAYFEAIRSLGRKVCGQSAEKS